MIILAAVLTLSMNVLFASNDGAVVNNNMNPSTFTVLAPITPAEATFEDANDATANAFILAPVFAPVTPSVADFSDGI
jgi:hypothetical protein